MKEQERKEFLSVFFGRVVSREVVGFAEPGKEKPLERAWTGRSRANAMPKDVPIAAGAVASRHIVDLKPFASHATIGPRPDLDFEQKISVFTNTLRSAAPSAADEHRAFMPSRPGRKSARAPIGGFLKLPFALLALPFRSAPRAARPMPA
jgi:hypothetical protein